jgi:hypothetical protein
MKTLEVYSTLHTQTGKNKKEHKKSWADMVLTKKGGDEKRTPHTHLFVSGSFPRRHIAL